MTETVKAPTTRGRKKVETAVEETTVQDIKVESKRVLQDTDRILVMNNTTGVYGYHGTNGYAFDLADYGQTVRIPLSELRLMASGKQRIHLTKPWIIVLDEDVAEELNLTKIYEHVYKNEEIDVLLGKPDALKEVLPKMTSTMQTVVVTRAKQLYNDDKLHDLKVVNVFKDVLEVNIME